ncbi:GlcNAc-transferase family protein [Thiomicrospira microaerophila]|uniref:GlcNAc-transferase family protein n=1 Tax=Thiomicrospira microaerophila TaxID=406020 RepID=UPI0005C9875C|nr:GlcNAc-transferase family protein [Thiomicrospira microaerophila]
MQNTIFVSVAAFNESFLSFTLQDALSKAKHPERLIFGVVDQYPASRREEMRHLFTQPKQLRYVHIDPVEARGVCWARSLVQSLFNNEDFYFQIDSHTFFEPNWDTKLIEQYQQSRHFSQKPILSVYPFGFEFDENLNPVVKIKQNAKTTLALEVHPDTDLTPDNVVLRFRATHVNQRGFIAGFHLAGGFIFTSGNWVDEIPYDPRLYFHGEEQNLAIRSFTRGWDIYHPPHIPLYHLYKVPNTAYQTHHWHADWEQQRDVKWPELKQLAHTRLQALFANQIPGGFGLGRHRTLDEFNQFSGIDYTNRTLNRQIQRQCQG